MWFFVQLASKTSRKYLSEEEILKYICDDGIPSDCESTVSGLDSESDNYEDELENTNIFSDDLNIPIISDETDSDKELCEDTANDKICWDTKIESTCRY